MNTKVTAISKSAPSSELSLENIKNTSTLSFNSVAEVIQKLNSQTPTSKKLAEDNKRYLSDKSSIGLAFSKEIKQACYPIAVEKATGAYLWDIDGNQYTDILNGLGINLFGHNPEFINHAISKGLENGYPIGPQSPIAGETAELFCQLTGMDRVTFSNTGTEAVMTAIRIARTATKRDKVAVFTNSYHGHFDAALMRAPMPEYWRRRLLSLSKSKPALSSLTPLLEKFMFTGAHPAVAGIPKSVANDVMVLDYNNPKSLAKIKANRHRLAAVLVEPIQSRCIEIQPQEFLHQLRDVTAAHNIALIFDEMVTGFRLHQGGAQTYFDVEADLATYSKIAGGGLPLSIVAGRQQFMNYIDGGAWRFGDDSAPSQNTTFFAGTFCRHPLSLLAANAVAKKLQQEGPELQQNLNKRTAIMVAKLNDICHERSYPINFTHAGSFFAIDLSASQISQDAINILSFLLLIQGIHLRGGDKGGFISAAHSDQDIEKITQAFLDGLNQLKSLGYL